MTLKNKDAIRDKSIATEGMSYRDNKHHDTSSMKRFQQAEYQEKPDVTTGSSQKSTPTAKTNGRRHQDDNAERPSNIPTAEISTRGVVAHRHARLKPPNPPHAGTRRTNDVKENIVQRRQVSHFQGCRHGHKTILSSRVLYLELLKNRKYIADEMNLRSTW